MSKATAFIMYKLQFLFLSIRHVKLAHMKGWDLLPSAAEIIFTCIFLQLVLNAGILLSDGDTGYHIRAGEFIINARTVPKTDIFSLWIPPLQWTAHEWLSEVLMAVVHHHAGLTGIVIFFFINHCGELRSSI
jgi:hypothetical protein